MTKPRRASGGRFAVQLALIAAAGLAIGVVSQRVTATGGESPPGEAAAPTFQPAGARLEVSGATNGGRTASWMMPEHDTYDAVKTAGVLDRSVFEQFESETRVAAFAERREVFLRDTYVPVMERLAPGTSVDSIECRAGSCRIVVRTGGDDWARSLQYYLAWGDKVGLRTIEEGAEGAVYEVVALSSRETREHAWFEQVAGDRLRRIEPDLVHLRDHPGDEDAGSTPTPTGVPMP